VGMEPALDAPSGTGQMDQTTIQQYNTSWGTETPPGTSQQANFEAHGRLMLKANIL